jgi:ornithine decarboxylase
MVMAPSAPEVNYDNNIYHCHNSNSQKDQNLSIDHHGGIQQHSETKLQSKQLIVDNLKKRVAGVDIDRCSAGDEDAFYVADMGEIYRQHLHWKLNLARVKPFYGETPRHPSWTGNRLTEIYTSSGQVQSGSGDTSAHGSAWQWV